MDGMRELEQRESDFQHPQPYRYSTSIPRQPHTKSRQLDRQQGPQFGLWIRSTRLILRARLRKRYPRTPGINS